MKEIPIGTIGSARMAVTPERTAKAVGSGALEVFATPCMAALMEQAACACVAPYLEAGETTVGTKLDIDHVSATPAGMTVTAECTLTAAEGRKLTFTVAAKDDAGPIGSGTHERFLIQADRFMEKCRSKLK